MARLRKIVETQLEKAKNLLATYESQLKEKNPSRAPAKDPKWRHFHADVKRFEKQLQAVSRRENFLTASDTDSENSPDKS